MIKKVFCLALIFLLFLQPAVALRTDWNKKESSHFIVYYSNAEKGFVKKVIKESEKNYRYIGKNLGLSHNSWTGDNRAKIYIFDDRQQFQSNTSQPEWSDGSSILRFKTIFSFFGAKKFFDTVLPHEITHIIFREYIGFTNRAVPAWFEEGVASYHERIDRAKIDRLFKDPSDKNAPMSISELSKINSRALRSESNVDIFFAQSISIVNFLFTKFGNNRFSILCRSLKENTDFNKALKDAYSFSDTQELERAWLKYLREK